MNKQRGFTLIELLVVISIIALLISILMPALNKAREQAKAAVCKAHLHEWGIIFAMYAHENNDKYTPGWEASHDGRYTWIHLLRTYYDDKGEILYCPKADKLVSEGATYPCAAWDLKEHPAGVSGGFGEIIDDHGSYGVNWWVTADVEHCNAFYEAGKNKWKGANQRQSAEIPLFMDSGFFHARPLHTNTPPLFDGDFDFVQDGGLKRVCHDRHSGGISMTFMDSHVQKVGLKELWRLKWHRNFDTNVYQTIVWPDWMDNL